MLAGEKEVSNKADTLREEEELLYWEEVDEERYSVERVRDTIYLIVFLGYRQKATANLWAKRVTNVDPTKKGGYALEGDFLKPDYENYVTLVFESENDLYAVVKQTGSWRHPGQNLFLYRRVGDKIYFTKLAWWDHGSRQKTIQKIYEDLFKKKRSLDEIIAAEIKKLEEKYNVKINWELQK